MDLRFVIIMQILSTCPRVLVDLHLDVNGQCDDLDTRVINLVTLCRCKVHLKQMQLRPDTLSLTDDTVDVSTN